MRQTRCLLFALLLTGIAVTAAHASPITYSFSGLTKFNQATVTGTFTYDSSVATVSDFSFDLAPMIGATFPSAYQSFGSNTLDSSNGQVYYNQTFDGGVQLGFETDSQYVPHTEVFLAFTGLPGSIDSSWQPEIEQGSGSFFDIFQSGSAVVATPTPEPASWILLLSGVPLLLLAGGWYERRRAS